MAGGYLDGCRRRSAEVQRNMRLKGRKQISCGAHTIVLPTVIDRLTAIQPSPDRKKFVGLCVSLVMGKKQSVALQFVGIATRYHVNQDSPTRLPVECCGHAIGQRRTN